MPQGKHSSVRVALAVPPKLHEQLAQWADDEGRPVASLCMYLIEQALRQAQREGIAPSLGKAKEALEDPSIQEQIENMSPGQVKFIQEVVSRNNVRKGVNPVSHSEMMKLVEEEANQGKYIKSKEEMTKKERIMTALSEALFE